MRRITDPSPVAAVFPAGSFFQNNNSILPSLTDYVRQAIFEPPPTASVQTLPTHLVDTYCGSGLFAITLSPHFEHITGIEIDPKSIMYAERNAKLNKVDGKCVFKAGKSEEIFETVTGLRWDKTAVVIDVRSFSLSLSLALHISYKKPVADLTCNRLCFAASAQRVRREFPEPARPGSSADGRLRLVQRPHAGARRRLPAQAGRRWTALRA